MLVLAEGLFRLDVVVSGDTLRTVVRNLSSGELEMAGTNADYSGGSIVLGGAAEYEPAQTSVEFALGAGGDRVVVKVLIGILHFAERGTVRVTGQAVIHQAPVS